ncbi:MAG: pyridoxamine 5-phosphate oxidase [Ilumatobacteraceae bacterium]|nr:pyridoxamine 5-phosphate oxidase [Ilumatobacteraceae bacterium]
MSSTDETRTLADLTDGIRVAMLTLDGDDGLEARPLTVQKVDGDRVWFLVGDGAEWLGQTGGSGHLSFVDDKTWVSATGTAELVRDPAVIEELGDPVSGAWFQEDQSPIALRIDVEHGSWWTAPNAAKAAIGLVKAKITKTEPDIGEHGSVS